MSLGAYCDELGLTDSNLLEQLSAATQPGGGINNGQAYEIMMHVRRLKIPWQEIRTRIPGASELTDQQFVSREYANDVPHFQCAVAMSLAR